MSSNDPHVFKRGGERDRNRPQRGRFSLIEGNVILQSNKNDDIIEAIQSSMNATQEREQKIEKRCMYCGNNPISHRMSSLDAMFHLVFNPVLQKVFQVPGGRYLYRISEYVLDGLWQILVITRILTFRGDVSRVPSARGKVLHIEATRRGWNMETAVVLGRSIDIYKITLTEGKKIIFNGLPRFDTKWPSAIEWIDDKALLKQRLLDAQVPVSHGQSFSTLAEAEKYFELVEKPVIVKPRIGSRGRHTTTFITSREDFQHSFKIAQQLGRFVIVEKHLEGSVYRATMVDGVLAGVLAGDPPRITGDGAHTISELIEIKNKNRDARVSPVILTDHMRTFLQRRNYSDNTVLEHGVTIDLSEKIGLSYGGKSREVTPDVHPKLRAELERAARVVDDAIIGFDFITSDVSCDPDTVRWGIIECNALPFINLHHDPLEGKPVNVAGMFLDYVARKVK